MIKPIGKVKISVFIEGAFFQKEVDYYDSFIVKDEKFVITKSTEIINAYSATHFDTGYCLNATHYDPFACKKNAIIACEEKDIRSFDEILRKAKIEIQKAKLYEFIRKYTGIKFKKLLRNG